MLTMTSVVGSDDWWLMRLATELGQGFPRMHRLKRYRYGDAPLPEEADPMMRESYARFISMSRLNFAEQLANSVTGRKRPIGFRTGAPGDSSGDLVAAGMWNENHMTVQYRDLADDEATYGKAYLAVTGQQANLAPFSMPTFIRSNGWNTAVAQNALRPWTLDAAVTIGHSPLYQVDTITLMRPGYFRQAFRRATVSSIPTNGSLWLPGNGWEWVSDPIRYGFTEDLPMTEFAAPNGIGEFELHIDTLDRINHTILQRMTITAMQAFRQRGISPGKDGEPFPEFYPENHPKAGQKIDYDEVYKAGPAALWFLPVGATVWESGVTDIRPILEAITSDLKHLAGASSTPLYVLSPEAANGSAEGAALARETNLTKVRDRLDRDTSALARSMSFGFQALRDLERADAKTITTLWEPIDIASLTQKATAAKDAAQSGLSQEMVNEKYHQLTPVEMEQENQNRIDDVFKTPVPATA